MKSMGLLTQLCQWAIALLLVAQLEARRSSHDFEHCHSVMYALRGAFWAHVICRLTTGIDVSKTSLQNGCFAFADMS